MTVKTTLTRGYRDTFTVTEHKDGSGVVVRLHGYPFEWHAETAKQAMEAAGVAVDRMRHAQRDMVDGLPDPELET